MTQKDKQLNKFLNSPDSFKFQQIKTILFNLNFTEVPAKGSHLKFKHPLLKNDLIIPIHNNDCKKFYKQLIAKTIKQNKLNY